LSRHAVELCHRVGDRIAECAALDQLSAVFQELDNAPEAAHAITRRLEVIGTLAADASSGFEFTDTHLMASDIRLAMGDLAGAGDYADRLALLPFYRDEEHLGIARRVMVDALTGNLDDVVRNGKRFRVGWERAGRPAASDLAKAAYALAMVHGMLDDEEGRADWIHITIDLGVTSHLFRVGHRIRVDVSSSSFPRFDRNLNTGEPIAHAPAMQVAQQTVHHSEECPSQIILPVVPRG